jgi:hypothetical protein
VLQPPAASLAAGRHGCNRDHRGVLLVHGSKREPIRHPHVQQVDPTYGYGE